MNDETPYDLYKICRSLQEQAALHLRAVGAIRLANLSMGDLAETLLYRAAKELYQLALEMPNPKEEKKFLFTYLKVALYQWLQERAASDQEVIQLADAWAKHIRGSYA